MNQKKWKMNYIVLWSGQAISLITSAILQMAIIWYLTDKTGSAMLLSLATLVGFLPQAILGTMIGALVDRWNRKYIMIGADLLIAITGVVMALIATRMELPIWSILVILLIRSIGTAFHSPALNAVTPLLVPEEMLTKCAGYSQSIQSVSYILSPAIAAFVYATWDLNVAILLDVLGAMIACLTVVLIAIPKPAKQELQQGKVWNEVKEGYEIIKTNRQLYVLIWVGAIFCFIYMPVSALFPLMSMNYFGGTTTHASIVEILFAVGMLLGSFILSIWGGFQNRMVSLFVSLLMMGISLIISGLLPWNGFLFFVICSGVMGFASPFYQGVQVALIQEKIPPEYLGRVFGLFGSIMSLAMPLGLITSGIFAELIGVNVWFFLSGIAVMGLVIISILLPVIRDQDNPKDKK